MITFDRWHAGFLGCFGNPWVDTPHLDELAVRGTVFDHHFAEDLSAQSVQHAWWTGRFEFPLAPILQRQEPTWLPLLKDHGIQTTLVHDPRATVPLNAEHFTTAKAVSLDDIPESDFERDLPKFVRAAIRQVKQMTQTPDGSELLWIHAGGVPIDETSLAYEELYADEVATADAAELSEAAADEEDLPDFPPRMWRRNRASPRELADAQLRGTGWKTAGGVHSQVDWQRRRDLYMGQVTQWDAWVGRILQAVTALREQAPVLLIFTAATGEHLGEHAALGPSASLFEEQIHVPLIVELPLPEALSGRRQHLTQTVDLPVTLLDWFQVPVPPGVVLDGHSLLPVIRDDQSLPRENVFAGDSSIIGVRTADIYFRLDADASVSEAMEMIFLKPDDRWDADNMVRQYTDTADELSQKWQDFVAMIRGRAQ